MNIIVGKSWEEKVEEIRKKMKEENCCVLVATALDEVACQSVHTSITSIDCFFLCDRVV